MIDIRLDLIKNFKETTGLEIVDSQKVQKHSITEIITKLDKDNSLQFIEDGKNYKLYKCTKSNHFVKVLFYQKDLSTEQIHDTMMMNNKKYLLLRKIVEKKRNPHFLLPLYSFCSNIQKENLCSLDEKDNFSDDVEVLITEYPNREKFIDLIKRHANKVTINYWRTFFFQILSALHIMHYKKIIFSENTINLRDFYVNKIFCNSEKFTYTVNKKKYQIINVGYNILFGGYDCMSIANKEEIDDMYKNIVKNIFHEIASLVQTQNNSVDTHVIDFIERMENNTELPCDILKNDDIFFTEIYTEKYAESEPEMRLKDD